MTLGCLTYSAILHIAYINIIDITIIILEIVRHAHHVSHGVAGSFFSKLTMMSKLCRIRLKAWEAHQTHKI